MKCTFLCLVLLSMGATAAADGKRPNVLVILADDMGYSDAGCYGGEIRTPNLDALARGGLRFTQFYNTARCWPTRAVITTGYYAQQVRRDAMPGLQGGGHGTRPGWAPLVAEMLKPLGYRTYHSGKWHIDGKPLENGFDHAYTLYDQDRFFTPSRHAEDDRPLPPVEPGSGYYASTAIADHAIKCLEAHARAHADQPFYHYLCFTSPHFPLHTLQEDIDRYRDRYLCGWDVIRAERARQLKRLGIATNALPARERVVGPPYDFPKDRDKLGPGEVLYPVAWEELNDEQRKFQATKMAIHAAMVDRMDREMGRVVDQLKAMGVFENTLILFASDNGASAEIMVRGDGHDPEAPPGSGATFLCLGPGWSTAANTPFRRHKTWVHEGGISTPLIAHWPKGIDARGELRHSPTHLIDIVPTVLELAGGEQPKSWKGQAVPPAPGRSLVPLFAKDGAWQHDSLWWCHDGHRAIRAGDWKLVADRNEPWELYNLNKDRGESNNLAETYPEKVGELEALWNRYAEEFRALATQDLPAEQRAGRKSKKKTQ